MVRLHRTEDIMGPGWEDEKTISLWIMPLGESEDCPQNDVALGDLIFGDQPRWWGISRGIWYDQLQGNIPFDRIWIWNNDGKQQQIGIPYKPGEWMHISLVHYAGHLIAYKNGQLMGYMRSGTTSQPHTGAKPILNFGGAMKSEGSGKWTFEGMIDELQIWNIARTEEEIRQDMLGNLTGYEPGLMAYYKMSDGAGTTVTDDSQFDWHGTLYDGWAGVPPDGTLPQWIALGS